ncbi:hypothetical protein 86L [Ranavirus ambystoma1]|uniref:Protein kinase domain-containing protein n=1 Tax=Ranavirus ambystoma1 TaxID=265294 RepID=A0A0U2K5A1_9VIRU|nr:hypothetical protein 86L [Ambystoma tigrinum virus]
MATNYCDEFERNPTRNPRTGRTIKRGGPVFRALERECSDGAARVFPAAAVKGAAAARAASPRAASPRVASPRVAATSPCPEFARDPTRNPRTGRTIKRGGHVFRALERECADYGGASPRRMSPARAFPNRRASPAMRQSPAAAAEASPCPEFARDPTRNPRTGRTIKRGGPVFRALERECADYGRLSPIRSPSRPPNSFEVSGAARVPGTPSVCRGEPRWMSSISTRHNYDESNPMSVAFRLRHVKDIRKFLRTVKPGRSGFCATDKGGWLGSAAVSDKVIGQGSWGSVHMVKFRDFPKKFVVKEAVLMSVSEKRRYKPTVVWDEWAAGSVPNEVAVNNMVTEIAATGMTPFVPLTAGAGACDSCNPQLLEKAAEVTKCYLQAMEAADFSLDRVLPTVSPNQAASALAQILLGLQSLQTTLGIMHNDIKAHNILVKRVPPGGYWKVTDSFNGQVFYVPNEGYLCMLADYGVVRLVKPAVGMDTLYGTRNARFVPRDVGRWGKGAGTEYVVTPIRSKISVVVRGGRFVGVEPNTAVRYWKNTDTRKVGDVITTNNVFYMGYDIEPDMQVQLDDTNSFPVWESRGDVVDCVRTFVGGKRASQPGFHGLFYKKTGSAWEKAAETVAKQNPLFSGFALDGSGLKYIRAATACAYIFPGMSAPRPGEREIESFTM